jgi:Ca2+-binding EF-hand superfamily protein
VSSGLSPEDGYDAFDVDEDGKVSLLDLQNALKQLELDTAAAEGLHRFLDINKEGFVDKALWVNVMASTNTQNILKTRELKRGQAFLPASAYAGTRPGYVFKKDKQGLGYYWDLAGQSTVISGKSHFVPISIDDILDDKAVSQCTEKGVYHLIGVIAASLASTGLSPEDGYDAFDVDEDGRVSLPDLQNALEQLDLDSAAADGLHRFLDVRKEGFVDRGLWVKEMASASTKAGIDSKSLGATRTRPQLEEQVSFSRLSCDVI